MAALTGTVKYSATYIPTGSAYLALYGWTTNPLIKYYIVENHGDLTPGEPWTLKGNFTSEEDSYTVYQSTRVNKPYIVGFATSQQYRSVRMEVRTGGMGKQFNEWNKLGMRLGQHKYMILTTEGFTNRSYPVPSRCSSITLS